MDHNQSQKINQKEIAVNFFSNVISGVISFILGVWLGPNDIGLGPKTIATILTIVAVLLSLYFRKPKNTIFISILLFISIIVVVAFLPSQFRSGGANNIQTATQSSEGITTESTENKEAEVEQDSTIEVVQPEIEPDVQNYTSTETTQPEIEPEVIISVYQSDNNTVTLVADGRLVGQNVVWTSNDISVATITTLDSSKAKVVACGEGSTIITAEVLYNGMYYSDDIMVSVDASLEESGSGSLKYFYHLPEGIDTSHEDYKDLCDDQRIYASRNDAMIAANISETTIEYGAENKIGYVYYHWCRGIDTGVGKLEDIPMHKEHPHNRTSNNAKGEVKNDNGVIVDCVDFTCFFSNKHLSESTMQFEAKSKCVWFPNYDMCRDSYWYWPTPIMECTYTTYMSTLTISVLD